MNRFTPAMIDLTEATNNGSAPRCLMPWQSLMIDVYGNVQPCAYRGNYTNTTNAEPYGNINEQSLEEIWNGPIARKVRRCMAAGDLENAGCAKCLCIAQGQALGMEYDLRTPTMEGGPYADNLATKVEEILSGAEECASTPTVLYFTPDHRCNLACVHCYQNISRKASTRSPTIEQDIIALLPTLSDVIAGGGEPLILPFWRRFLASAARVDNPHLKFSTTTNATILRDDVVAALEAFDRLSIIISLDGATKETFEHVRHPAKWEPFLANARRLRDLCAKHGHFFSFNISTMKANMRELPAFMDLCAEFEAPFNFQPVVSYPAAQSLRCFNDPAAEMAGWREAIDAARERLETTLFPALAAAAAAGRSVWTDASIETTRGHFDALSGLIPWHMADARHRRFKARLPEDKRALIETSAGLITSSRRDSRGSVVLFCDAAQPNEPAQYYAPINADLSFEVSLPDGQWRLHTAHPDFIVGGHAFAWPDVIAETSGRRITFRDPSLPAPPLSLVDRVTDALTSRLAWSR